MGHLTAEQLVDVAEGTRAEASLPHLVTCATCCEQLAELRATTTAIAAVDVPEPSPLFWDHFSTRVREAVAVERSNARSRRAPLAWLFERPAWAMWIEPGVAVLTVAVLVIAVGIFTPAKIPITVNAPASVTPAPDAGSAASDVLDSSLSLVADLAADLDWDTASEAGLTTHVGADEDAVNLLNDGERRELRQLLQGELIPSRRGA